MPDEGNVHTPVVVLKPLPGVPAVVTKIDAISTVTGLAVVPAVPIKEKKNIVLIVPVPYVAFQT